MVVTSQIRILVLKATITILTSAKTMGIAIAKGLVAITTAVVRAVVQIITQTAAILDYPSKTTAIIATITTATTIILMVIKVILTVCRIFFFD